MLKSKGRINANVAWLESQISFLDFVSSNLALDHILHIALCVFFICQIFYIVMVRQKSTSNTIVSKRWITKKFWTLSCKKKRKMTVGILQKIDMQEELSLIWILRSSLTIGLRIKK